MATYKVKNVSKSLTPRQVRNLNDITSSAYKIYNTVLTFLQGHCSPAQMDNDIRHRVEKIVKAVENIDKNDM